MRQSGYLMPLAAFILVAMAIMAATLMRTSGQTGISVAQEAITLQAFYAAESGAQLGMSTLYYDSASALTQAAINGRCDAMNLTPTFNASGLSNCNAAISCTRSAGGTASFYTITSVGNCGSGEITALRTVEVSAFFE
ncbi:MSHA biogenesis protein MshP [Porticoccus sp. W117]|uniref:MSHA biogenesis protein MshP n=1 Tax=Porticoccus sp. W117 TaxID=3054777 RepID=UPI00259A50A0|nr:MSHA biogenesis protein MshP [Porticoccus sp. W117]MDM3870889.1 MSHA biogenesis protein MshP [Porticoccus sp. W117]